MTQMWTHSRFIGRPSVRGKLRRHSTRGLRRQCPAWSWERGRRWPDAWASLASVTEREKAGPSRQWGKGTARCGLPCLRCACGRACWAGCLGPRRRKRRPAGPEAWAERKWGFFSFFFLFFKHFESFSNEFEFPFEIKQNQINSAQNMHQHECSSMYSNFDVDFILINLLFSLCLNAHTSKSKSI